MSWQHLNFNYIHNKFPKKLIITSYQTSNQLLDSSIQKNGVSQGSTHIK